MRKISDKEIQALGIGPRTCVEWAREAFMMKPLCQLPAKSHVNPQGSDFINTMPCLLPPDIHRFGVKVVSRISGRKPALGSDLLLYDSRTGELEAFMQADWITAMRTGAVATLAIGTFRREGARTYAFAGLGSTARATMKCLLAELEGEALDIRLLRYKDQEERFAEEFSGREGVSFSTASCMEELVEGADVVVSCITDAPGILVGDTSLFREGVLVVPVHTRGFQNCDTVFDKVFADDTAHVSNFRHFGGFRSFAELTQVLLGERPGRESGRERILSYNIGIGLHDVLWASKIADMIGKGRPDDDAKQI